MNSRSMTMDRESDWDRIWAEYDARQPSRTAASQSIPETLPSRPVYQQRVDTRRGSGAGWVVAALGFTIALIWQVARGVAQNDPAAISRHVDLASVQAGLRQALVGAVTMPAGGPAAAYLTAMTEDLAEAWARPGALAEVARARGVTAGAAADTLFRVEPVSLTSFDLPLGATTSPITLRFELAEGGLTPRWQVTGVQLDMGAPHVATGPTLRLEMR